MNYDRPFGPLAMGVFVALGFLLLALKGCGEMLGF